MIKNTGSSDRTGIFRVLPRSDWKPGVNNFKDPRPDLNPSVRSGLVWFGPFQFDSGPNLGMDQFVHTLSCGIVLRSGDQSQQNPHDRPRAPLSSCMTNYVAIQLEQVRSVPDVRDELPP